MNCNARHGVMFDSMAEVYVPPRTGSPVDGNGSTWMQTVNYGSSGEIREHREGHY